MGQSRAKTEEVHLGLSVSVRLGRKGHLLAERRAVSPTTQKGSLSLRLNACFRTPVAPFASTEQRSLFAR